jgi:hypothetical protein
MLQEENNPHKEVMPWHTYKPNIPQPIEGTEVPVVTDEPVSVVPKLPKREKPSQVEVLFEDDTPKKPTKTPTKPPYRARYTDTTDLSLRARRDGLEGNGEPITNPDADLDEIFGAPQAKKIVE